MCVFMLLSGPVSVSADWRQTGGVAYRLPRTGRYAIYIININIAQGFYLLEVQVRLFCAPKDVRNY